MSDSKVRALRWMTDELAREPAPEMDWDRMESRLLTSIAKAEAARPTRAPSSMARAFTFAAAAGFLVLGLRSLDTPSSRPMKAATHVVDASRVALAAGEAGTRGAHELLDLRVGDVVESGPSTVGFGHDGALTWMMAPGSRATVRAMGKDGVGHTLVLDHGAVRGEVVPRDASEGLVEAFAIEVLGTRVAVHGTAFTVEKRGDRVFVDVEHGTVAVGPVGHMGETSGHILVGPARASFSLDGGSDARWLSASDAIATIQMAAPLAQATEGVAQAGLPSLAPAPKPQLAPVHVQHDAEPAPVAPSVAAPAPAFTLSSEIVRAGLVKCFTQTHDLSSGVKVSWSGSLIVVVDEDGSVKSAHFDHPPKPEFVQCAGTVMGGKFAPGARTIDIPVNF